MSTDVTRLSKKSAAKALWLVDDRAREVMVFCPACKAMETLGLNSEGMVPTRRFTQRDGAVYHACGSDVPCRLYSLS